MKIQTTVKTTWNGKDVKIKAKKVINKTAYETGLIIEGQAKLLCPINFGYLAASITTQSVDGKGTEVEMSTKYGRSDFLNVGEIEGFVKIQKPIENNSDKVVVVVGTPVSYGPYQEFLHRPFLRPALDFAKGKELILGEINGRIEFKDYLIPKGSLK